MMKKVQQMSTMLPIGRRDDSSVCTTSFKPGALLMTLQTEPMLHCTASASWCHGIQGCHKGSTIRYVCAPESTRKPRKGADGHRRQNAVLVAAYVQSQSQASSLGQRGDKRQ